MNQEMIKMLIVYIGLLSYPTVTFFSLLLIRGGTTIVKRCIDALHHDLSLPTAHFLLLRHLLLLRSHVTPLLVLLLLHFHLVEIRHTRLYLRSPAVNCSLSLLL